MFTNIPPELLQAAENMTTSDYNLKVPATVEAERNGKDVVYWNEVVTIEGAHVVRKDKDGKPRMNLVIKAKVLPFDDTPNVGRNPHDFNLISIPFMQGETYEENESFFSARTITKAKQLATILGVDMTNGLTGDILNGMFPAETEFPGGESSLTGLRVIFRYSDDRTKTAFKQNVVDILPLGDDTVTTEETTDGTG